MRRPFRLLATLALCVVLVFIFWLWRSRSERRTSPDATLAAATPSPTPAGNRRPDPSETRIHAHNLLLRKGPDFRVYVQWLDGRLARTHHNVIPSLDDAESFYLDIQTGVVRANIGDIGAFLSKGVIQSPLRNVTLLADGDRLKLTGTVHKGIPVPVQVILEVSPTPDNRIRAHVVKLDVLKIPVKGLLSTFKISLRDLVKENIDGMQIVGDDVFLDTQKLIPAPHIRGKLTSVRIASPDLLEVFGNAAQDVERVELWRNFLALKGGSLDFGKLTMNNVDLIMIDISKDPWFDLDLVNYQKQLNSGYTRITSESAVQIFMPDLRDLPPSKAGQDTNIEWFKNRNIPPPAQITNAIH
jgi:hypothetical protein